MDTKYIDIHSHLQSSKFDADREAVIASMEQEGVATITIGTGLRTSGEAIALAEQYVHVWATVGLHPADDAKEDFDPEAYEALARHECVVAIGECGLDYHYIETFFEKDKVNAEGREGALGYRAEKGIEWNKDAEADRQKRFFEEQIELAVKVNKPLMLHGRPAPGTMDAYEDMCDMLKNAQRTHGERVCGNFHFFAGNLTIAKQALELGFTISFPGVITFADQYDDVVRYVPLDMMHGETDSPYAAPKPFRGQRNEPNHVREVYKRIAELRGDDEEKVRVQLLENARRMFGIVL